MLDNDIDDPLRHDNYFFWLSTIQRALDYIEIEGGRFNFAHGGVAVDREIGAFLPVDLHRQH